MTMLRTCFPAVKNGQRFRRTWGGSQGSPGAVRVAPTTRPLTCLAYQHVLVVADCQNLNMGASNLGFVVDWRRLGQRLAAASRSISRHAFISEPAETTRQAEYFARTGWTPHSKMSRVVQSRQGPVSKKNTDHLIAFFAGVLASRSQATLVLIASGDGDLVEDLSEALTMLPRSRPIATLSVAGSTNQRLDAQRSRFVVANIELGMDCLKPGRVQSNRRQA
jgi:hypothetical protein